MSTLNKCPGVMPGVADGVAEVRPLSQEDKEVVTAHLRACSTCRAEFLSGGDAGDNRQQLVADRHLTLDPKDRAWLQDGARLAQVCADLETLICKQPATRPWSQAVLEQFEAHLNACEPCRQNYATLVVMSEWLEAGAPGLQLRPTMFEWAINQANQAKQGPTSK